jgi:uncharacterized membrane protein
VFSAYLLLKFVHVAAVVVWVGGMVAGMFFNARLALEREPALMQAFGRQAQIYGMRVMMPSAIVTLITGIGMLGVTATGVSLWTTWGLLAVFVSIFLGAAVGRPAGKKLAELSRTGAPDPAVIGRLRRRLSWTANLNVLVLFSTVAVMVFKPN